MLPEAPTAAPISGLIDECECVFEHHMKVTRIHESPRVTKPYTDEQWSQVLALGVEHLQRLTQTARRRLHGLRRGGPIGLVLFARIDEDHPLRPQWPGHQRQPHPQHTPQSQFRFFHFFTAPRPADGL